MVRPGSTVPATARPVDHLLRGLSRSANKGRLWLAVAAVGALVPGRTRRAAIRGAGALAATSLVVNAVLKPVAHRRRPLIERTPLVRRLPRRPRTASFPSGHAASAAAFATGVALETTAGGAVLAPVAAAVGYSRVHVGVHHVSDVMAGVALGAGFALLSERWWPVRTTRRGRVRAAAAVPALPSGDGLVVVANPRSGADDGAARAVRERLPGAEVVELADGADLAAELRERIPTARAVGVAGGDGSVAAAVAAVLPHRLPLAIFPAGTRNHFALDAGITSFDDTVAAVGAGEAMPVDVAAVNGVPFVNTAVIGAYPEMVRRRDALTPRVGRWLATALAAGEALRRQTRLHLTLDGRPVQAWTLFVGNCRYVPQGPFPTHRPDLQDGRLEVQYLRADTPLSRTRAVLSALAGVGRRSRAHPRRLVTELLVVSPAGPVRVAYDGEPAARAASFRFTKLPRRLAVYRPHPRRSRANRSG